MPFGDLTGLLVFAPGVLLYFVRSGAFLIGASVFGAQQDSRMLRLVLAVSLAAMFWWAGDKRVPMPSGPLELGLLAVRETVTGLIAGFSLRLMVAIPQMAGEILATEMGFAMSRIVNPATGTMSTSMSQLFTVIAYLLIFATDTHHEVLRVLASTYEAVPVGEAYDYGTVFLRFSDLVAMMIGFGLHYAIPMLGVMMLLTVVLVLLARAVQNINLLEFAFALRILLGISVAVFFIAEGAPFLMRSFAWLLHGAKRMFLGV